MMTGSSILRDKLLRVVQSLPSSPHVLALLGHKLADVNTDLDDIALLLKRDAALTARIIRISNSAVYSRGCPNSSIEEALGRVGFTEVYRLTGFAATAQLAEQKLPFYGVTGQQLRENSLLVALLMEVLAESAGLDPRAAYTAGLLRSTGKIALDRLANDVPYAAGGYDGVGGLVEWETNHVCMNNCEASGVILFEWRFPAQIVMAIMDHYLLEPAEVVSPFTHMLNIAAEIAERAGHGLPGESIYWQHSSERYADANLDEGSVGELADRALCRFEGLRSIVA